jgi:PKD repeat protein
MFSEAWIVVLPGPVYCGNDGGLYSRRPGANTFTNLTSGLNISQIYRIGQSAQSPGIVIAGWQDNGTGFYRNSISGTNKWRTTLGGDGMECIIDPNDSDYMYGALYYGDINGTSVGSTLSDNIGGNGNFGINEQGAWVTPYALHNKNTEVMLVGYKNLWRGTDIKGNPTWKKLTTGFVDNIVALEQCESDTSRLYYSRSGRFYRTDSLYLASPSFVSLTSRLPNPSSTVNWIETHPNKPRTVYIIQSNTIYRSNDTGNTWTNITGALPAVAKNCLLLDRQATDGLYVGTDVGVFYRDSTMTAWVPYKNNLPANSRITELEMYYDYANTSGSRISASTYGRGLWQSDVYLTNSAPQADFYADTIACVNLAVTLLDLSTGNPDTWKWTITPGTFTFVNGTDAGSQSPQVKFTAPGNYTIKLYALRKGRGYSTLVKNNIKVMASAITGGANPSSICDGEVSVLSASGMLGFSWYDGSTLISTSPSLTVNPTTTTTYKLVGKNGDACSDSINITVTVNSKPSVSVTPVSPKIALGQYVTLTANGATTYSWSPAAGLNTTAGASVVASPAVTTTYTVLGTDGNNCKDTQSVTVTIAPVGITPIATKQKALMRPNPAYSEVNFIVPEKCLVKLYDITGKVVFQKELAQGTTLVVLEQLPKGIYTAEFMFREEKYYSKLVLR